MENELIVELQTHELRPDIFLPQPAAPYLNRELKTLEWAFSCEGYIVRDLEGLNQTLSDNALD